MAENNNKRGQTLTDSSNSKQIWERKSFVVLELLYYCFPPYKGQMLHFKVNPSYSDAT